MANKNREVKKYREAKETDFEDIFGIYSKYNSPNHLNQIKKSYLTLFKKRTDIFNYWVIINSEDIIVGYASLIKTSHNIFRENISAELSVYLDTDIVNSGLGIKLAKYIIAKVSNSKLEFITAYISKDNLPSIRGCKSLGFLEIGEIPKYKSFGNTFSKVLFIKPLNET